MPAIEAERTLAELVLERPGRAEVFEELQLDYCCGGSQSLAEAAEQLGLDARTLVATLRAAERVSGSSSVERDWSETSLPKLCDHIVNVHHTFLRRELPRIGGMLTEVEARHGEALPRLEDLATEFDTLRESLVEHMDEEERGLFLLCYSLGEEGGELPPDVSGQLFAHEVAHDSVGEALASMRELGDDYDAEAALSTGHGVLLTALNGLERELHQHIHEENNVLFPRLRAYLDETQA